MSTTYEHSIIINRPIDVVFKNATCLKGCVNWQASVNSAEQVSEGTMEVGTLYKHNIKFMGMSAQTMPVVSRLNPPYEFAFKQSNAPIPFESTFTFEEVPGGTKFTCSIESENVQSMLGKVAMPVFLGALKRQFDSDMSTLKELLESDVTVHAQ
jgi:hypothetical protein